MLWTDAEQHANQEKILENVNDRTKEDSDSDNHPEESELVIAKSFLAFLGCSQVRAHLTVIRALGMV